MAPVYLMQPVFVQVLLTFVVLIALGVARQRSLSAARTSRDDPTLRLGNFQWSETATKVSNNFKNQFELPVLFYAGSAFALALDATDVVLVGLAWVFVVSRLVHAGVHTGVNIVRVRGAAYGIGALALFAFWIVLAFDVLV